ncbi:ABC transporter permease [Brevibacillus fulvus]|uniref:ABC transport system permease protein n=1 Tax=Brevibacillus fulvus TaxID=1125967 RepID=A0A939BWC3_9BACL|nr:ABC transporter permease [Brevibacillus fulvus]MBM7592294.1 putative ABC transport system permease protein [Brevibacillus fulvus]
MTFSLIKNQFKAHPVTTLLIISGLTISILLISIGISSIKHAKLLLQEQIHYSPQNATKIDFAFQTTPNLPDVFAIFTGISEQTGVILEQVSMFHNGSMSRVIPEYWTKQVHQRFPLVRGRYINEEDIRNGEKVALVGQGRLDDLVTKNGKEYIVLDHEDYQVVGIIGVREKMTKAIDSKIVIPATSLSHIAESKWRSKNTLSFTIHNLYKDTYPDEKQIKQNAKRLFPGVTYKTSPSPGSGGMITAHAGDEIAISLMVYALTILNAINLTSYWIQERKYEIGIKKAFGYSNFDIIFMLFGEMCIINLIAVVFGFLLQLMISRFLSNWLEYPVEITPTTLVVAIVFVFVTACLTTAVPSIRAIKIQPVEAIRG